MSATCVLTVLAASTMLASGAELRGGWSASAASGQRFGGSWTAEAGGATGTWTLYDAAGKILLQGGWSVSKSPKAWSGAWRATVAGRSGEYSGTWTASPILAPEANFARLLESALNEVVTGAWKAAGNAGAWSIRASP